MVEVHLTETRILITKELFLCMERLLAAVKQSWKLTKIDIPGSRSGPEDGHDGGQKWLKH